jgi:hypothetical protein
MSLGVFGAVLAGVLVLMCAGRTARLRTVITALSAVLLGMVIAGTDGALAHEIVDWARTGLTAGLRAAASLVP